MRIGIGAKIVSIVVVVLVAALLAAGSGYRQFEVRVLSPGASPSAPELPVSSLIAWYHVRHTWTGAGAIFATIPHPGRDLVLVQNARVRACSAAGFEGASATDDGHGNLQLVRQPSLTEERGERLRVAGAPAAVLRDGANVVGEIYAVPQLSLLQPQPAESGVPSFARRLLVFFLFVGVAAAVIAAFLAGYVVRPIRELTAAARAASGDAFPRVAVRSNDEIGELAGAFNALGERLAISEAARDNLISDVAHELRTPLTNVRCALESFQDGIDEATPRGVQSILTDVLHLERLIADLNDLGATAIGPMTLDRSQANLLREARSAAAAFGERAAERNVRIDVRESGAVPAVMADPVRIRQVLHNLLDNALLHGRRDGTVSVEVSREPRGVRVAVRDDGEGFPASEEAAVFERFHRLDASRSRTTGGSGLGLSIAKRLVEAHGGQIGAIGGLGHGATVWFTLPVEG